MISIECLLDPPVLASQDTTMMDLIPAPYVTPLAGLVQVVVHLAALLVPMMTLEVFQTEGVFVTLDSTTQVYLNVSPAITHALVVEDQETEVVYNVLIML